MKGYVYPVFGNNPSCEFYACAVDEDRYYNDRNFSFDSLKSSAYDSFICLCESESDAEKTVRDMRAACLA